MDLRTILIISFAVLYVISTIMAFPTIKELSKQGFYRIPFIPLPQFFIKKHGQEVYDNNKALVDRLLGIKWVSSLSIIGICVALVMNRL